jgi:hypothetical protein
MRRAWRTGDSTQGNVPQGVKDPDKVGQRQPGQAIARAKARKADAAKKGEKPSASHIGTKLPGFRQRERAGTAQWQKARAKEESFFGRESALYESMQTGN